MGQERFTIPEHHGFFLSGSYCCRTVYDICIYLRTCILYSYSMSMRSIHDFIALNKNNNIDLILSH